MRERRVLTGNKWVEILIIYRDETGLVCGKGYDNKRGISRPGKKGEEHPNWKGGKVDYYQKQARKIMEKYLGRELRNGETVHHLDGNTRNNDIKNMYLFQSNSEHTKYHSFLRNCVKEVIA